MASSAGVGVAVLLKQLVIVESFTTIAAHKLVVPGVFALVVAQSLGRGETVTALVTDEAPLSIVESLVDILQMSGGEKFSALGARKLLLIVVFGRHMLEQRLLSLELFGTVGTGKCFAFKMQLEVSLHVALGCEHFATLHTSVLSLDFGMSLHVLLVKFTVLEFSAAHFCRVTLKHQPQSLKSHIQSFGPL